MEEDSAVAVESGAEQTSVSMDSNAPINTNDLQIQLIEEVEVIVDENYDGVETEGLSLQVENLDEYIEDEIWMIPANSDDTIKTVPLKGSLIGVTRKTEKEMYELYCEHARVLGFSVRRSKDRKSPHDATLLIGKYYICSCAGKKSEKETVNWDGRKRKKKGSTRTDCRALMVIKLNDDNVFEVDKHVLEHNHHLIRPEMSHLLRSSRQIDDAMESAIRTLTSSGLKATQSYRLLAEEAGGSEYIGHSLVDHFNLINKWKMLAIEGGDAQNLYDLLQEKEKEDDDFFYKVRIDIQGRLSHIFWRDSLMKEDYDIFGDVVVFDTTYRTNRYNLICAPFVGLNHHWKNVMFACAFLSDEKIDSFEWLFNTFRKSMGGKSPVTIFTDQDHAISSALQKVFPTTRHRLCTWHLHQNATSRLGNLKSNPNFKEVFQKCITGCIDKIEFEKCWSQMISDYNLQNHSWFGRLYDLREKWCTALNKEYFSAGILSSQRSESTNSALGFRAKKTTSLTEFFGLFDETVKSWREKERLDEFQCSNSKPDSSLLMTGLLKHASEVYTLTIFKLFEKEFKESISCDSKEMLVQDNILVYNITPHGSRRTCGVIFDSERKLVSCECKKFEESGILCKHCLRVYHINSIDRIPDDYIVKRWRKEAKVEVWDRYYDGFDGRRKLKDSTSWRIQILRKLQNTVSMSQDILESRNIVEEAVMKMHMDVVASVSSAKKADDQPQSSSNSILDPSRAVTKGRSQRKKGHLEKKRKTSQISSNSSQSREIGSRTPNIRLI